MVKDEGHAKQRGILNADFPIYMLDVKKYKSWLFLSFKRLSLVKWGQSDGMIIHKLPLKTNNLMYILNSGIGFEFDLNTITNKWKKQER